MEVVAIGPETLVGHLLRRCHQVHNVVWAEEVGGILTSPQYSVLSALVDAPGGRDQHSLGQAAGLDRSTTAGVVRRLEGQGWLRRVRDPDDARRQRTTVTAPSRVALEGLRPKVQRVQDRLLVPLAPGERAWFIARLAILAELGEEDGGDDRPGHLIRRAQQRHTALWAEEVGGLLTGPQYAVLSVLADAGTLGQGVLAEAAAVDRSSASDVLGRLEARGWTVRSPDPADRRTRQVSLTGPGRGVLETVRAPVRRVQDRILEPVAGQDRGRLVSLLSVIAGGAATLAPATGAQ